MGIVKTSGNDCLDNNFTKFIPSIPIAASKWNRVCFGYDLFAIHEIPYSRNLVLKVPEVPKFFHSSNIFDNLAYGKGLALPGSYTLLNISADRSYTSLPK